MEYLKKSFLIVLSGKSVDVLKAKLDINLRGNEIEFVKETFLKESDSFITSVVPGDFNSDSQMDILITKKPPGESNIQVEIYSGNKPNGKTCDVVLILNVVCYQWPK